MQVMTAQIPAWQVMAYSPVVRTPERLEREAKRLRHVSCSAQVSDRHNGLRCGQVVWATGEEDDSISVAWEWEELRADVLAIADPMNIISNVSLVDGGGYVVGRSLRMVYLNNLIHSLPWRDRLALSRPALQAH